MSGEDQERFEDYLELENYIEELQAGHSAQPPAGLAPSQASIYRMAALFRSATPEASEPRPEFAAELQGRLEQELFQAAKTERLPQVPGGIPAQRQMKKPAVSRRSLLVGGAAVAASLAVGTGLGMAVERDVKAPPPGVSETYSNEALIGGNVPTAWHLVINLAQLGEGAVQFTAGAVVGYIVRADSSGNDADTGQVIAMSAACTHMGCIVQWQASDRKFHCPCHGGLFTEYGTVDKGAAPVRYYSALPRLHTMVDKNGDVYVEVPRLEVPQRQG
jgi:nitrite reductase/ring-hydroxylating ferredoxin subunit